MPTIIAKLEGVMIIRSGTADAYIIIDTRG
jgi:hypothetical protein